MTYRVYIKKDYKPEALRAKKRHRAMSFIFPVSISCIALIALALYIQPISFNTRDIQTIEKNSAVSPEITSTTDDIKLEKDTVLQENEIENSWATANEQNMVDALKNETEQLAADIHDFETTPDHIRDLPDESKLETVDVNEDTINDWQSVTVKKGDSLALIFSRLGLSANELYRLMSIGGDVSKLKKIQPGQILHFQINEGKLTGLEYDFSLTQTLSVSKDTDKFSADLIEHKLDAVVKHAKATINDSLFLAGKEAGLTDNLIMQLVALYGWDIDFALDIRRGDSFTLIYEEKFKDGERVSDGPILAAEFVNNGETIRAIRYEHPDGSIDYYEDNGAAMRKAFLRTPVNFTRISSRFNLRRKHPILNKIRAHKGVDYAAPTGTPIKATGDGTIVHAGRKGGYGKTVILRHGGKYSTVYAHLHKYARGIKNGRKVKQGQVIGYVGKSGLATGPHLHYEFRINGVHRNPLTVKLPHVESISKNDMPLFKQSISPMLAELDKITGKTAIVSQQPLLSENNASPSVKEGG